MSQQRIRNHADNTTPPAVHTQQKQNTYLHVSGALTRRSQRGFLVGDTAKGSFGDFFGHQVPGIVQFGTTIGGLLLIIIVATTRSVVVVVHGGPLQLANLALCLPHALEIILVSLGQNMFLAVGVAVSRVRSRGGFAAHGLLLVF